MLLSTHFSRILLTLVGPNCFDQFPLWAYKPSDLRMLPPPSAASRLPPNCGACKDAPKRAAGPTLSLLSPPSILTSSVSSALRASRRPYPAGLQAWIGNLPTPARSDCRNPNLVNLPARSTSESEHLPPNHLSTQRAKPHALRESCAGSDRAPALRRFRELSVCVFAARCAACSYCCSTINCLSHPLFSMPSKNAPTTDRKDIFGSSAGAAKPSSVQSAESIRSARALRRRRAKDAAQATFPARAASRSPDASAGSLPQAP